MLVLGTSDCDTGSIVRLGVLSSVHEALSQVSCPHTDRGAAGHVRLVMAVAVPLLYYNLQNAFTHLEMGSSDHRETGLFREMCID